MAYWTVVIAEERYAQERLVGDAALAPGGAAGGPEPAGGAEWAGGAERARGPGPAPGDRVALVAATEPPVVFGLGAVGRDGRIRYTRRLFDAPLPAEGLAEGPLPAAGYEALVAKAGPAAPVREWIVGVDLPIEADTAAEAVRRYWSYLRDLGPTELPAFVSPVDDELAMQAYVMGEEAALDPEED